MLIMQVFKGRSDVCIMKIMVIHSNMVASARSKISMDLYKLRPLVKRKNNAKSFMAGVFIP